jgi:ATP synthase protein I
VIKKPENRQKSFRQVALATTIPLIMVATVIVGLLIGRYLDRRFETDGVMTIIFLLLGLAAGGVETYRLIKEIIKEDS